jgi:hypothetical protein
MGPLSRSPPCTGYQSWRLVASADVAIADDQQADWINLVLRNHIAIVQSALQLLGVLMDVVGVFTLASAMSTSVAERARKFGIMQTLGAVPGSHHRDRGC